MSQEERIQLLIECRKLLKLYFNSKDTLGIEIFDQESLKNIYVTIQKLLIISII